MNCICCCCRGDLARNAQFDCMKYVWPLLKFTYAKFNQINWLHFGILMLKSQLKEQKIDSAKPVGHSMCTELKLKQYIRVLIRNSKSMFYFNSITVEKIIVLSSWRVMHSCSLCLLSYNFIKYVQLNRTILHKLFI